MSIAGLLVLSLLAGAGGGGGEPVAAAEGRQFAVVHIVNPNIEGPYTHPALPPGGIKVIGLEFDMAASATSGDPNDPWGLRPQFSTISVTKELDKSSPNLAYYCAVGQHFDYVFIRMLPLSMGPGDMEPTEPPYYEIVMEDVVIAAVKDRMVYRDQLQDGTYAHLEEVSFAYGRIKWLDVPSGVMTGWNLESNKPLVP